jgi:hypothetical protein
MRVFDQSMSELLSQPGANIMTTFPYAQETAIKAKRVTIGSVCKVAAVPADFIVVCLWALTGLMLTALFAACVGSIDFADFLAAAG